MMQTAGFSTALIFGGLRRLLWRFDPLRAPAGSGQCDAVAAFNLYPSMIHREFNRLGSNGI
jgi:hypothetical protein